MGETCCEIKGELEETVKGGISNAKVTLKLRYVRTEQVQRKAEG